MELKLSYKVLLGLLFVICVLEMYFLNMSIFHSESKSGQILPTNIRIPKNIRDRSTGKTDSNDSIVDKILKEQDRQEDPVKEPNTDLPDITKEKDKKVNLPDVKHDTGKVADHAAKVKHTTRIPKRMNQIYISKGNSNYWDKNIGHSRECEKLYSQDGWSYKRWTMDDPIIKQLWQKYSWGTFLQKIDMIRYELGVKFGGFFIDFDFQCARRIDGNLDVDFIGTPESPDMTFETHRDKHPHLRDRNEKHHDDHFIVNGFFGSSIDNPILKRVIQHVTITRPQSHAAWIFTGPLILSHFLNLVEDKSTYRLIDTKLILPHHYSQLKTNLIIFLDDEYQEENGLPYFVQYWSSTSGWRNNQNNNFIMSNYFINKPDSQNPTGKTWEKCNYPRMKPLLDSIKGKSDGSRLILFFDYYCTDLFNEIFSHGKDTEIVMVNNDNEWSNNDYRFLALKRYIEKFGFTDNHRFVYLDLFDTEFVNNPFIIMNDPEELYMGYDIPVKIKENGYVNGLMKECYLPDYETINHNELINAGVFAGMKKMFMRLLTDFEKHLVTYNKDKKNCNMGIYNYIVHKHKYKIKTRSENKFTTPFNRPYDCNLRKTFKIGHKDKCG